MTGMTWRSRIGVAVIGALVAFAGWAALLPAPAQARVYVGIGVPFPGYGYPCCGGYPYPYPPYGYGYPPPPGYYPPAPGYYPGTYAAPVAPVAPAPAAQASAITYTDRPAFTNASGQSCREFKTAQNTLGTACQDSGGQWRVQN